MKGFKRQPPLKGGRTPRSSGFCPALDKAVKAEMRRFNTSRSHVVATATAWALGVKEQEDYREPARPKPRKRFRRPNNHLRLVV